jgi:hypothetical protein
MARPTGFDADGARRVARALRRVEAGELAPRGVPAPPTNLYNGAIAAWVLVTDATPVGGRYPGRVEIPDVSTSPPTWEEYGDVWLIGANEEELVAQYYDADCVGAVDGVPVYMTFCCG